MSILIRKPMTRRSVLRGAMKGAGVAVALPLLDCFLAENGQALATGAPLPLRFGTWFWSMGHTPGHAVVADPGKLAFLQECQSLTPTSRTSTTSDSSTHRSMGGPNHVHHTGWVSCRTATAPVASGDIPAPTLDVLVSDAIGTGTRFKSIDMTCTGNPRDSFTARNTNSRNAGEVSPLELYKRLFGAADAVGDTVGASKSIRI